MPAGFREFFRSRNGQYVAFAFIALGVAAAAYSIYSNLGPSEAIDMANHRPFIDAKTGKLFYADMKPGVTIPVKAPSGGMTGYPPEACYWTKDGKIKDTPTYVLLNSTLGKSEPTFCPDCGRLVRSHNPMAMPGRKPPPTKEQYESTHNR